MFAEEVLIPIIAIVGFFSSIIVFVYMFFNTRYRVKMALIEQDKDATIFNRRQDVSNALKYGMVAIMVGLGILLGFFLEQLGIPGFVAYTAMVLILGGAGLLMFYRYISGKRIEEIVT